MTLPSFPRTAIESPAPHRGEDTPLLLEMLYALDATFVTVVAVSRTTTATPTDPTTGDLYIVPAAAVTGEWVGHENAIAVFYNGWSYITPETYWKVRIADDSGATYEWSGSAWVASTPPSHTHTHASTTGQGTDDHHAQSHTIASHPDQAKTGAEVDAHLDSVANPHGVTAAQAGAAPAAEGVTNGDAHDHVGGDGAQIDHAGLANKGTETHATIDSHLAVVDGNPHGVDLADMDVLGLTGESPPSVTSVIHGETSGGGPKKFTVGNFVRDADFGSHAILRSTAMAGSPASLNIPPLNLVGRRSGNVEAISQAEQGGILRIPLVKYYTSGPANLNASTTYADLDFDNEELTQGETDGWFSHDTVTNPDEITCEFDGTVEVSINVPQYAAAARPNVAFRICVNGTPQRTEFKSSYIRNYGGHNESSSGGVESFAVSDGDIITIQYKRESVAGTVTVSPALGAIVQVKRIG